jgi:hypothetical protein
MKSNVLSPVDQGVLTLVRRTEKVTIPSDLVFRQPTLLAAINLCISASGLEDKEIYMALEIDPGHWTRMRKGDAHFPTNKLDELMDLCGNEAPLEWSANKRGKALITLKSELERKLEEVERKLEASEQRGKVMSEILQGRAVSAQ